MLDALAELIMNTLERHLVVEYDRQEHLVVMIPLELDEPVRECLYMTRLSHILLGYR